eukprot:3431198-Rhodomonas_salina.2
MSAPDMHTCSTCSTCVASHAFLARQRLICMHACTAPHPPVHVHHAPPLYVSIDCFAHSHSTTLLPHASALQLATEQLQQQQHTHTHTPTHPHRSSPDPSPLQPLTPTACACNRLQPPATACNGLQRPRA